MNWHIRDAFRRQAKKQAENTIPPSAPLRISTCRLLEGSFFLWHSATNFQDERYSEGSVFCTKWGAEQDSNRHAQKSTARRLENSRPEDKFSISV